MHGSKPYRPFVVKYSDGRERRFDTKPQLAKELNVTRGAVNHWLRGVTNGYTKFGISSINYV